MEDAFSQVSDLASEISEARGARKSSKDRRLVVEAEKLGRRLAAEIQRLRAELLQSREQTMAMAATLKQNHLEGEALKQRMDATEQIKESLQSRVNDLIAQLEVLRVDKASLETRLVNVTRDSDERSSALSKDLSVALHQRDMAREEAQQAHELLRDTRSKCEAQLEHAASQHDIAMTEKERIVSDLRHQLDALELKHRQEVDALQRMLDTEKASRVQEVNTIREQLAELSLRQREKLSAASLHGDQSSLVHELQLEVVTLRQECSRAKQSEVRKDQENFQLQQRIGVLEGQRAHLTQQNRRLEDAVAALEDKQAALSQEIFQLTSDRRNSKHASCVSRLRELQEKCGVLEQALAEAQQRNSNTADEAEKNKTKLALLRKKYETLKQYNRQLLATTNWYESTLQKYDAMPIPF